jgi:hypothetical protein
MNPNYVDNVVGNAASGDSVYLTSAGWDPADPKAHHMHHGLYKSDSLGTTEGTTEQWVTFECAGPGTFQWRQGLLFNTYPASAQSANTELGLNPSLGEWGPFPAPGPGWMDVESAGTPPSGYEAATSTALNMRKIDDDFSDGTYDATWDVTLGGSRSTMDEWRSPPLDGYPSYNSDFDWEWPVIYEMSWDVSGCTDIPPDWTNWDPVQVDGAHASPEKSGWTNCSGEITIEKEVTCGPDCEDDTVDFGFDFFDGTNLTEFWLDDPQPSDTDAYTNTRTFTNLTSGTYEVTEDYRVAGWLLQQITCSDTAEVTFGSGTSFHDEFAAGDDTVRIELRTCETVLCTFANDYAGVTSVGVSSFAVESGGGEVFTWLGLASLLGAAAIGFLWARQRNR